MMQAKTARVINALANQPEIFPFVSADPEGHAALANFEYLRKLAEADDDLLDDPDFMRHLSEARAAFAAKMLDLTECVERPEHYIILHNGKSDDDLSASIALMFEWSGPDMYEMHTMARSTARGGEAYLFARECIEELFFGRGVEIIWGQTAVENERARAFFPKLGAISRGFGNHHMFGPVEFFRASHTEYENTFPNARSEYEANLNRNMDIEVKV